MVLYLDMLQNNNTAIAAITASYERETELKLNSRTWVQIKEIYLS